MKRLTSGLLAAAAVASAWAIVPQELQPSGRTISSGAMQSTAVAALRSGATAAGARNTFFEGFEDRPDLFGTEFDEWLPYGWQDVSQSGHTVPNAGDNFHNLTWRVTSNEHKNNGPSVNIGAYEGECFAYIMADVAYPNHYELDEQDEWLIMPAVTPADEDWLYFKLFFAPGWTTYNREANDFTGRNNCLEVYASTDDGTTWTKLWNLIDDEILTDKYTEDDLRGSLIGQFYTGYTPIYVNIKDFRGRPTRFAFRYFGSMGHPMAIDNVAVGLPSPKASYELPTGAMRQGLSPNVEYPLEPGLLIPHDCELLWTNTSIDVMRNEWNYADAAGEMAASSVLHLTTPAYPALMKVPTPTLTGYFESMSDTPYQSGFRTMTAGGVLTGTDGVYNGEFGVGYYDITDPEHQIRISSQYISFYEQTDSAWEVILGRMPGSIKIDALCNYYPKSSVPYGFDYIDVVALIKEDFAPEATLGCMVYSLDEYGQPSALIGYSSLSGAELPAANAGQYVNLRFKFQVPVYASTDIYVLVTNPFADYDGNGSTYHGNIAFPYVMTTSDTHTGNTLIYSQAYQDETGWNEMFINLNSFPLSTGHFAGILMNLGASYSWLERHDEATLDVPLEGGTGTFRIKGYHTPDRWALTFDGVTEPEWITYTTDYDDASGAWDITVNVGENPYGFDFDTYLWVVSPGSIVPIAFTQPANPASAELTVMPGASLKALVDASNRIIVSGVDGEVTVADLSGRVVAAATVGAASATVVTPHLPAGVYIVAAGGGAVKVVVP